MLVAAKRPRPPRPRRRSGAWRPARSGAHLRRLGASGERPSTWHGDRGGGRGGSGGGRRTRVRAKLELAPLLTTKGEAAFSYRADGAVTLPEVPPLVEQTTPFVNRLPRDESVHEAAVRARERLQTEEFRRLHGLRPEDVVDLEATVGRRPKTTGQPSAKSVRFLGDLGPPTLSSPTTRAASRRRRPSSTRRRRRPRRTWRRSPGATSTGRPSSTARRRSAAPRPCFGRAAVASWRRRSTRARGGRAARRELHGAGPALHRRRRGDEDEEVGRETALRLCTVDGR